MVRLSERGISYLAGFFMLAAFGAGGALLGNMLAMGTLAAMTGKSIAFVAENVEDWMLDGLHYRETQIMHAIVAVMGFLVPTLFTAWRLSTAPLVLTGLGRGVKGRQWLLTLFIVAAGLAVSSGLGYFSHNLPFPVDWRLLFDRMERGYAENVAGVVNVSSWKELAITLGVLALLPAVCEEVFFRGGLQNYLYRSTGRFWWSVIVVSIIFSAVHFSVYGFLSRMLLSIVLGLLYQYSGRLWPSILAHFINNAAAVVVIYVEQKRSIPINEILNDSDGSYWGLLAAPVLICLFIWFKNRSSNTTNGVADDV